MSSNPAIAIASNTDRRSHRDVRHDAWFRRLLKVCALLVLAALLGAALSTLWGIQSPTITARWRRSSARW